MAHATINKYCTAVDIPSKNKNQEETPKIDKVTTFSKNPDNNNDNLNENTNTNVTEETTRKGTDTETTKNTL